MWNWSVWFIELREIHQNAPIWPMIFNFFFPRRVEDRVLEWWPPWAQLCSALCTYGFIYLLLLSLMGRGRMWRRMSLMWSRVLIWDRALPSVHCPPPLGNWGAIKIQLHGEFFLCFSILTQASSLPLSPPHDRTFPSNSPGPGST